MIKLFISLFVLQRGTLKARFLLGSYNNNPLQMNKAEIQRGHKEASKYTFDCDVLLKV